MVTGGYIDPTIRHSSQREAAVLAAIRRRGLNLHRVHPDGQALRLTGPDVFVLVADLAALSLADIDPPTQQEIRARARLALGA